MSESPLDPEQVEIIAAVQRHLRALGQEIEEIEQRHSVQGKAAEPHWWIHTILTYDAEAVGEFTDELGDNSFFYYPGYEIAQKMLDKSP